MGKTISNNLFELVHSLSSSEKRYFKYFVSKHIGKENQLSLKLFDLIAKNPQKSGPELEKKIKFTKHPSRLKNYLYQIILDALENYRASNSFNIMIRKNINRVELLYEKALYKQCVQEAAKCLKQAEEIDSQQFKIEIINWYINALKIFEDKKSKKRISELYALRETAINKLKLEAEYSKIGNKVFEIIKQVGSTGTNKTEKLLNEIMDNPLMSDYSFATSFMSKKDFNSISANFYQYMSDAKKMQRYIYQNVELYEAYPKRKETDQYNYITLLNNYALSCARLQQFDKANDYFQKLKEVIPNSEQIKIKIFEYVSCNYLDVLMNTGKLNEASKMIPEIEAGFKNYGNKITPLFKRVISSNVCSLAFYIKEYKLALKYNNIVLEGGDKLFRSDVYRFGRLMNLMILFKLDKTGNLEGFLRSYKHYLSINNKIYNLERWFLNFYSKLLIEENKAFTIEELNSLAGVLKKSSEYYFLDNFNILAWIKSETSSLKIGELLNEYSLLGFEIFTSKYASS